MMNRQQRRAMGVPKLENRNITLNYGVSNDRHVLVSVNQPIDNLRLTVEQAKDMVEKLQKCIEHATEPLAETGPGTPPATAPDAPQ